MITARRLVPLATIVALASAAPPRARCGPAPSAPSKQAPTAADLASARAHFRDAEAAKARGDYKLAAVEYLAAYELFEEPEFFFDVAEVYRLAGDEPNALTYYERYLQLEPHGRGAPAARAAADALRRSIAVEEDAARRAAEKAARDAAALAAERAGARPAHPSQPTPAPPPTMTPEPVAGSPAGGRGLRIAGIASGGAGVVLIGAGVVFGLRARAVADEASGWTTFDPHRYDQGQAAQRDMFVLTGAGAAALVAGGVLYYLGHRAGERRGGDPKLTFTPSIDGSTFAFTVAGRF